MAPLWASSSKKKFEVGFRHNSSNSVDKLHYQDVNRTSPELGIKYIGYIKSV